MHSIEQTQYSIYSNYILLEQKGEFVEGYICIRGEVVQEVIEISPDIPIPNEFLQQVLEIYPVYYNFKDLFVFPGLVDINVHLHLGHEWQEVELTTTLAAMGGVTSIVVQPIMMSENLTQNEVQAIEKRKQAIAGKSKIDYGFVCQLNLETVDTLPKLYQEEGVLGFKIYLTNPLQFNVAFIQNKQELEVLLRKISCFLKEISKQPPQRHSLQISTTGGGACGGGVMEDLPQNSESSLSPEHMYVEESPFIKRAFSNQQDQQQKLVLQIIENHMKQTYYTPIQQSHRRQDLGRQAVQSHRPDPFVLLVHSIKSGQKELGITSPLRGHHAKSRLMSEFSEKMSGDSQLGEMRCKQNDPDFIDTSQIDADMSSQQITEQSFQIQQNFEDIDEQIDEQLSPQQQISEFSSHEEEISPQSQFQSGKLKGKVEGSGGNDGSVVSSTLLPHGAGHQKIVTGSQSATKKSPEQLSSQIQIRRKLKYTYGYKTRQIAKSEQLKLIARAEMNDYASCREEQEDDNGQINIDKELSKTDKMLSSDSSIKDDDEEEEEKTPFELDQQKIDFPTQQHSSQGDSDPSSQQNEQRSLLSSMQQNYLNQTSGRKLLKLSAVQSDAQVNSDEQNNSDAQKQQQQLPYSDQQLGNKGVDKDKSYPFSELQTIPSINKLEFSSSGFNSNSSSNHQLEPQQLQHQLAIQSSAQPLTQISPGRKKTLQELQSLLQVASNPNSQCNLNKKGETISSMEQHSGKFSDPTNTVISQGMLLLEEIKTTASKSFPNSKQQHPLSQMGQQFKQGQIQQAAHPNIDKELELDHILKFDGKKIKSETTMNNPVNQHRKWSQATKKQNQQNSFQQEFQRRSKKVFQTQIISQDQEEGLEENVNKNTDFLKSLSEKTNSKSVAGLNVSLSIDVEVDVKQEVDTGDCGQKQFLDNIQQINLDQNSKRKPNAADSTANSSAQLKSKISKRLKSNAEIVENLTDLCEVKDNEKQQENQSTLQLNKENDHDVKQHCKQKDQKLEQENDHTTLQHDKNEKEPTHHQSQEERVSPQPVEESVKQTKNVKLQIDINTKLTDKISKLKLRKQQTFPMTNQPQQEQWPTVQQFKKEESEKGQPIVQMNRIQSDIIQEPSSKLKEEEESKNIPQSKDDDMLKISHEPLLDEGKAKRELFLENKLNDQSQKTSSDLELELKNGESDLRSNQSLNTKPQSIDSPENLSSDQQLQLSRGSHENSLITKRKNKKFQGLKINTGNSNQKVNPTELPPAKIQEEPEKVVDDQIKQQELQQVEWPTVSDIQPKADSKDYVLEQDKQNEQVQNAPNLAGHQEEVVVQENPKHNAQKEFKQSSISLNSKKNSGELSATVNRPTQLSDFFISNLGVRSKRLSQPHLKQSTLQQKRKNSNLQVDTKQRKKSQQDNLYDQGLPVIDSPDIIQLHPSRTKTVQHLLLSFEESKNSPQAIQSVQQLEYIQPPAIQVKKNSQDQTSLSNSSPQQQLQQKRTSSFEEQQQRSFYYTAPNSNASRKMTYSPLIAAKKIHSQNSNRDYLIFLTYRPPFWEYFGINMVYEEMDKLEHQLAVPMRLVFTNVANSNSFFRLSNIKEYLKKKNIFVYSDTAGAYLYFDSRKIKNGETIFKVEPPIGTQDNRSLLQNAIDLQLIDSISSYHFAVPLEYKTLNTGNFRQAFSGITSIGCTLQAAWSSLYKRAISQKQQQLQQQQQQLQQQQNLQNQQQPPLPNLQQQSSNNKLLGPDFVDKKIILQLLKQLGKCLASKPAKMMGIYPIKGSIAKGKHADFVVWDPFQYEHFDGLPKLYKYNKGHIFRKRRYYGVIQYTFLRGQVIYNKAEKQPEKFLQNQPNRGTIISKSSFSFCNSQQ